MKRVMVILLAVAILPSAFAQEGNLKTRSYLRVGFSIPTWRYYGRTGASSWPDGTKRTGAILDYGTIFMLNAIKITNGVRLGVNVDYLSLRMNRLLYNDVTNNMKGTWYFGYAGSKFGPSFSYSPVKHLVFDTYFKFNPVWAAMHYEKGGNGESDKIYFGFIGWKYSVGLNVRYSLLMAGFEFNPGRMKFRQYDQDTKKLTSDYLGSDGSTTKNTTPVPAWNFTVGLNF
jgi:hypothetical protein